MLAYNPTTKSVSAQTVQQVFINHDTDLIDVTLAIHPTSSQSKQQHTAVVSHGSHAPPAQTEVVHTTQKHPWLTTRGWITAGQLHLGNEVQLLDGSTATVVGLKIVPGMAAMYDLTVSNVHTFAVGTGQFVVHNCSNISAEASQAQNRATELGNVVYKKIGDISKNWLTVGVAVMKDDETGEIGTFVSTNQKASSSLIKLIAAKLGAGESLVSLAENTGLHAEGVLTEYADLNGKTILGLGASLPFCEWCGPGLLEKIGQGAMGQVIK